MGFLRKKKKKSDELVTDATGQYIIQGSPISNISLSNLPSPSDVKGQSHLLLMPFYQEIMEEECQKVEINDSGAKGAIDRKKKIKSGNDGESDASDDVGIDFNTEF